MADELWSRRGYEGSIHLEMLPEWSKEYTKTDNVKVPAQIHGRLRHVLDIDSNAVQNLESIIHSLVVHGLSNDRKLWKHWVGDKNIERRIYIESRLLNLILDPNVTRSKVDYDDNKLAYFRHFNEHDEVPLDLGVHSPEFKECSIPYMYHNPFSQMYMSHAPEQVIFSEFLSLNRKAGEAEYALATA